MKCAFSGILDTIFIKTQVQDIEFIKYRSLILYFGTFSQLGTTREKYWKGLCKILKMMTLRACIRENMAVKAGTWRTLENIEKRDRDISGMEGGKDI